MKYTVTGAGFNFTGHFGKNPHDYDKNDEKIRIPYGCRVWLKYSVSIYIYIYIHSKSNLNSNKLKQTLYFIPVIVNIYT